MFFYFDRVLDNEPFCCKSTAKEIKHSPCITSQEMTALRQNIYLTVKFDADPAV